MQYVQIALFFFGGLLASQVNRAIYSWAWFNPRLISPWSPMHDEAAPRKWIDRIPIVGWLAMRRDVKVHGTGFWVRPLLIEVAFAVGLPLFYQWQVEGGLFVKTTPGDMYWPIVGMFFFHSVLIALMVIATFIDFDERIIPDEVTFPGTIFALCFLAIWPACHLPIWLVTDLTDGHAGQLNYASPANELSTWHSEPLGLLFGILCLLGWCFALTPKLITGRKGFTQGIRLCLASMVRPSRKTNSKLPARPRKMAGLTIALLAAGALGSLGIAFVWSMGGDHWTSLLSALFGMAFGGGVVWAVRIIGTYCLGQEAMGFGDVTLLAMIGAFLGWQPALVIFLLAPFSAILVAVTQFLITGKHEIAFGPYLCVSALFLLLGWGDLWNTTTANDRVALGESVFSLGSQLLIILAVGLVLMGVTLFIWQGIKMRLLREPS